MESQNQHVYIYLPIVANHLLVICETTVVLVKLHYFHSRSSTTSFYTRYTNFFTMIPSTMASIIMSIIVDYYNGAGPIIVLDIIMDAMVDNTSTMNTEEAITSNHHSFTMY